MEWLPPKHLGEFLEEGYAMERQRWDIPETWLPMHYFEAMNCLFRIENALRILVYFGLKREFNKEWANITLATEDAQTLNLKSVARKRAARDEQFEYLTHALRCPLMYLTAGELTGIIFSESYWRLFKRYIPGSPSLMQAKLQEISCIRNALAHFRPVTVEQVEVLKKNGFHLLSKFDRTFHETLFGNPIKGRRWRIPLHFGNKNPDSFASCNAGTSKSGEWMFFIIQAEALIVDVKSTTRSCEIDLGILDLDRTIETFPSLPERCIFATHNACFPSWDGDSKLPSITKSLRFVFPTPKGTHDLQTLLTVLPEQFLPNSAGAGLDGKVLFRRRKVTAKEHAGSQVSKSWYIPIPELLGENDGSNSPPTSIESWGSLNLAQATDHPLLELPEYPWMGVRTVPLDY